MIAGYELTETVYDEAFEADGQPRPQYAELLDRLESIDLGELDDRLRALLREREVTFGGSPSGYFNLDLVPRILTADDWDLISRGIVQRADALASFTADVYGDRRIVAEGVLPERVLETSEHFEPSMLEAEPPRTWVTVIGFDLVRTPEGEFEVLEDQIRMPSGLAYAAAAREAISDVLPATGLSPAPIHDCFERLGAALRAAAPEGVGDPTIVLLSPGEDAAGWYEHARLGRELSIPVVTPADLEQRGGELLARIDGRGTKVDVVYQRTDEDRFTDADGRPTALGELMLEPCRRGTVACVDAPGAGIGDDKLVHAYVEEMVGFYLAEEPILRSVTTYDLGDDSTRERAMEVLDELVIKPRQKMGGEGVVVWSQASDSEREAALDQLKRSPEDCIAQRRVELSNHPTVIDGQLEPRHVDLRPFVIRSGDAAWAMPGGLSRVALERGSLIVNSGQGGGVKDTWVIENR